VCWLVISIQAVFLESESLRMHRGRRMYTYDVQLHLRGIVAPTCTRYSCTYTVGGTAAPAMYSCTYKVQLRLQSTAAPTRYRYTQEVQLYLRSTATPMRYSCTYEVQLHYDAHLHQRDTDAPTRLVIQLHPRGTATPTRHSYTYNYEVKLRL
jgi:hypothetical protein